jgi:hypothetical protein
MRMIDKQVNLNKNDLDKIQWMYSISKFFYHITVT